MDQQSNRNEVDARMREEWDARARENAFYYVKSSQEEWTEEEFYESGRESVGVLVMEDLERVTAGKDRRDMRVLEIGCGAGRMTRALAEQFGTVVGVDVSGEMVARARAAVANFEHTLVCQTNGRDVGMLADGAFDFAFSFIVFQHIPEQAVIENYVKDVARVLRPGGLFKFQVQGSWRPSSEGSDTWLGAHVSGLDIADWSERYGYEVLHSEGIGTQYFWIWLRKLPEREEKIQEDPGGLLRLLAGEVETAHRRLEEGDIPQHKTLLAEFDRWKEELERAVASERGISETLERRTAELRMAIGQRAALTEDMERLESRWRAEVEDLRRQLADRTRELEMAREHWRSLDGDVSEARQHLEAAQREKSEAQSWAQALDRELEATRAHIRAVYGSAAYRAGRKLGLAPEPLRFVGDGDAE